MESDGENEREKVVAKIQNGNGGNEHGRTGKDGTFSGKRRSISRDSSRVALALSFPNSCIW
jgi:hypothetical protein